MKNHYLISYAGNKRQEVENIYNYCKTLLNNNEIETIVEPFCGSQAFSYYISTLYPKKFKYILNDNDIFLKELYEIFKDDKKIEIFIKNIKNKYLVGINKEKYNEMIKENNIYSYFISHKIYSIRAGLYPNDEKRLISMIKSFDNLSNCNIVNFYKNEQIEFTTTDGIEIIKKYNILKSLIFIDPPYLNACNSFYNETNVNVYEYFFYNKINTFESKILLCLEKNWIIELLFNNFIKSGYNKKYQPSKKNTMHLLISNF